VRIAASTRAKSGVRNGASGLLSDNRLGTFQTSEIRISGAATIESKYVVVVSLNGFSVTRVDLLLLHDSRRKTMSDQRCPDCGEHMGFGYDLGDQCHDCWYLSELAKELAEMTDVNKIKARIREDYGPASR